jgi:hypothetical protein
MNHIFCFSCGHKMSYNLSPPNFCEKCGADQKSGTSKASSNKQAPVEVEESLAEDETNITSVPRLTKLDVETENFGGTMTIGQMAGQNTPPIHKGSKTQNLNDLLE